MEDAAVEGDDAGGFLAAVLQGVEAERDDRRGIRVAVDAEDAAFLAQGVAVEVEVDRGSPLPPVGRCCHERRSFGAPADLEPAPYVGSGPFGANRGVEVIPAFFSFAGAESGGPPPRCGSASS